MLQGIGKRKILVLSGAVLAIGWGLGNLLSGLNIPLFIEELIQQAQARIFPAEWA